MTREKAQALKWSTVTGLVVFMLTCFGFVVGVQGKIEEIVHEAVQVTVNPVNMKIDVVSRDIQSHENKIVSLYQRTGEATRQMAEINTELKVLAESTRGLKEAVERLNRKLDQ